jgi:hypothetical protein
MDSIACSCAGGIGVAGRNADKAAERFPVAGIEHCAPSSSRMHCVGVPGGGVDCNMDGIISH